MNFVLVNLYEDIFDTVALSKRDKRSLKAKLKTEILTKILSDRKKQKNRFEKAFLDGDNINTVFDSLERILTKECTGNPTLSVDDTFVKKVVEALAQHLQTQTRRPSTRVGH